MPTMPPAMPSYRPSWEPTVGAVRRRPGRAAPPFSLLCWVLVSGVAVVATVERQPRRPGLVPLRLVWLLLPPLPALRICWVLKSVNS